MIPLFSLSAFQGGVQIKLAILLGLALQMTDAQAVTNCNPASPSIPMEAELTHITAEILSKGDEVVESGVDFSSKNCAIQKEVAKNFVMPLDERAVDAFIKNNISAENKRFSALGDESAIRERIIAIAKKKSAEQYCSSAKISVVETNFEANVIPLSDPGMALKKADTLRAHYKSDIQQKQKATFQNGDYLCGGIQHHTPPTAISTGVGMVRTFKRSPNFFNENSYTLNANEAKNLKSEIEGDAEVQKAIRCGYVPSFEVQTSCNKQRNNSSVQYADKTNLEPYGFGRLAMERANAIEKDLIRKINFGGTVDPTGWPVVKKVSGVVTDGKKPPKDEVAAVGMCPYVVKEKTSSSGKSTLVIIKKKPLSAADEDDLKNALVPTVIMRLKPPAKLAPECNSFKPVKNEPGWVGDGTCFKVDVACK